MALNLQVGSAYSQAAFNMCLTRSLESVCGVDSKKCFEWVASYVLEVKVIGMFKL